MSQAPVTRVELDTPVAPDTAPLEGNVKRNALSYPFVSFLIN